MCCLGDMYIWRMSFLWAEFVDASMTLPAARTVQMDEREQNSTKSALGSFEVAASFFGWEILTYHPLS